MRAEKTSLDRRIKEVTDELNRYPYKLGLVYVTVADDAQAISIQHDLETRARQSGENRLIIALVRSPFTDDMRKQWLNSITKADMMPAGMTPKPLLSFNAGLPMQPMEGK